MNYNEQLQRVKDISKENIGYLIKSYLDYFKELSKFPRISKRMKKKLKKSNKWEMFLIVKNNKIKHSDITIEMK